MHTLARFLPAPATWGLILAALYVGRGKIDSVVRMVLLTILVVLLVLWILNLTPIGDTLLP